MSYSAMDPRSGIDGQALAIIADVTVHKSCNIRKEAMA